MFVIRKQLSPDDGAPPGTRYDPDSDTVQTTPDGGATWNDNPSADPRKNPVFQLAPPGEQCGAAAGIVAGITGFVNGVFGGTSLIGVATSALSGLVFLIPGAGWLWSLALGVAGGVLTAGGATLLAAFTPEVYEQLLCIFFCHLDSEGQLDDESAAAARAQILDELGGTVSLGIDFMFTMWGVVGFNNAANLYFDDEANCDDCACEWCAYQDYTAAEGDFTPGDTGIDWITGQGWRSKNYGGNNCQDLFGTVAISPDTAITYAAATFNRSCDIGGGNVVLTFRLNRDGSQQAQYSNVPGVCGSPVTVELTDEVTIDEIYIDSNSGVSCGISYLQRIELHGFGDPPTGWTLC